MKRFIVRVRGEARASDIAARINECPALHVVEETQKMVLVQGPEDEVRKVVGDSKDVVIVPEQFYERPDSPIRIVKE